MIGSGAVESSNRRIVTQRLEQSGMFWSQRGAQAIISLRAYFLSNFSRCRTSGVLCDKITELSLLILINSVKYIQGLLSSLIAYPIAERQEKRYILRKRAELHTYYKLSFDQRKQVASAKLADMIEYAGHAIPYYRDLFHAQAFDPSKLRQDIRYLTDIPFLTKEIIREQGTRLLSHPLQEIRHHVRPTGGSTGLSCQLYYDQEALDYSAAVTLYARETAGKKMHMFELHFASRFPDVFPLKARLRENFKCFTMNRYNLFFDRLDEKGLDETWSTLCRRKAHLVHAHPSTIYALACHIERTRGSSKAFDIFESSGELLEPYMRDKIERVLQCRVVDRYGLAEFGVIGYQTMSDSKALMVLDSEGWMESSPAQESNAEQPEIVFTGFRNRLMPLIRYRTGDLGHLTETEEGLFLSNMVGRIHDLIPIKGITYPTHYIQDVLDRVGGIQEFQIDLRETPPLLLLVPETGVDTDNIRTRLNTWWQDGFRVEFGAHNDLVRVGNRSKFRHVVKAMAQ